MKRWLSFINSRFNPILYTVTIMAFLGAHIRIANTVSQPLILWKSLVLLIATLVFFFLLRLFDELKDHLIDTAIHPDRPLVTGLILLSEAKKAVLVCVLSSSLLFFMAGYKGGLAFLVCLLYSFLMYNEFFIGHYLRKSLLLYAITHTFVSVLLSVALFSSLTDTYFWFLPTSFYQFALISWMVFNIFEFGRKSFAKIEERPEVDSYSKRYGSYGAVGMVFLMLLLIQFNITKSLVEAHTLILLSFITISLLYIIKNNPLSAKIYRAFCASYLVAIYLLVTII